MRSPLQALIVEADPGEFDLLVDAVRRLHLEPLPAVSPEHAVQRLRYNNPILAVVDLDHSTGLCSGGIAAEELLLRLFEEHGGCLVLVYSARADEIPERKLVEALHPFAGFVSKQDGPRALVERVRRMMGVRFGDLVVRRGLTTHEPTGEVFVHSVGASLVLAAALGQEVPLQDTHARAARRMRLWLEGVRSRVRVLDLGRRTYTLEMAASPQRGHEQLRAS
jgi:hypothetical protein